MDGKVRMNDSTVFVMPNLLFISLLAAAVGVKNRHGQREWPNSPPGRTEWERCRPK